MANSIKTTQKIDRLSNYSLQLGLKNAVTLTSSDSGALLTVKSSANGLTLISYSTAPSFTSTTPLTTLTHKGYVDTQISEAKAYADNIAKALITGGTRIVKTYTESTKTLELALGAAYEDSFTVANTAANQPTNSKSANTDGIKHAWFTGSNDEKYGTFKNENGTSGQVITAIKVDEYGAIIGVDFKKISTADLDNNNSVYDNYKSWQLSTGAAEKLTISGSGNGDGVSVIKFEGSGITVSQAAAGEGGTEHKVTFTANVDDTYLEIASNKISHRTQSFEAATTASLYKVAIDKAGHITSYVAANASDLTGLIGAYTGTGLGLVSSEAATGTAVNDTKFLTQAGTWAAIPYNTVTLSTATKEVPLVAIDGSDGYNITKLNYIPNAKITSNGEITATKFTGSGAGLTNLDATKIATGTLSKDRLPEVPVNKIEGISDLAKDGVVLYDGTSFKTVKVDTASETGTSKNYVLTQVYDSTKEVFTSFKDINTIVGDYVGSVDALVFKGTIGLDGSGANVTVSATDGIATLSELTDYSAGSTWVVTGPGFKIKDSNEAFAHTVEAGDKIMALRDYSTTVSYPRFTVSQANIDGAATFNDPNATLTTGELIISAGGRTLKGAGNSVTYDVTNKVLNTTAAKAKQLETAVTLWGNEFNGTGSLTAANNTIVSGHIEPATTETYNLGTTDKKYNAIYAKTATIDTITGDLDGNATTASTAAKLANALTIGTQTFDGSLPVNISIDNLGGITAVDINQDTSSSGNVVTNITKVSGDGTGVTFQFTKATMVSAIASTLLEVKNTEGSVNIDPYTSETSGKLYSVDSKLGYGGTFVANELQKKLTVDGIQINAPVLTKQYLKATDYAALEKNSNLLIAEFDASTNSYGFKASNVRINTTLNTTLDTEVPTSKAVASHVSSVMETMNQSAVKSFSLHFTKGSNVTLTTEQLPVGSVVRRIAVSVASTLGSEAVLSVTVSGLTLADSDSVDLNETGIYIVDVYQTLSTAASVSANITGGATGSVYVHIDYTTPEYQTV